MRSGFLLRDFYAILLCYQLFAVPGRERGWGRGYVPMRVALLTF